MVMGYVGDDSRALSIFTRDRQFNQMAYEAIYRNIGLVVWDSSSPTAAAVIAAVAAVSGDRGIYSELVTRQKLRSLPLLLNTIIQCPQRIRDDIKSLTIKLPRTNPFLLRKLCRLSPLQSNLLNPLSDIVWDRWMSEIFKWTPQVQHINFDWFEKMPLVRAQAFCRISTKLRSLRIRGVRTQT